MVRGCLSTQQQTMAARLAYSFECRRNESAKEAMRAAKRAYEALDDYVITNENIDTAALGAESEIAAAFILLAEFSRDFAPKDLWAWPD